MPDASNKLPPMAAIANLTPLLAALPALWGEPKGSPVESEFGYIGFCPY
jgi:hypothetical protein